MDRRLYLLCEEYTRKTELIYTLTEIDMENRERLRLFRLTQDRLELLEKELFDILVELDLKK